MKSLTSAFKEVYGELLAPYGFQKVKGRQPYFVRMVGEEIVHVITFCPRPSTSDEYNWYKQYLIQGGVATVYRKRIDFDITPSMRNDLTDSGRIAYKRAAIFDAPKRKLPLYDRFIQNDEGSMYSSLRNSFEITREYLLEELSQAVSLEKCADFLWLYSGIGGICGPEYEFGKSEGILYLKCYDMEQFERLQKDHLEKACKEDQYETTCTEETVKRNREKGVKEDIEMFRQIINNPEWKRLAEEELERRRRENLERLRMYGLKIE